MRRHVEESSGGSEQVHHATAGPQSLVQIQYSQENPTRDRECEEALTASRFSWVGCDVLGILTSPKYGEDDAGDS